jgi:methylenetetrahydrofolate dehydrogenase (NADP+)/methenyltetrahydrofolate cyclohydrolase
MTKLLLAKPLVETRLAELSLRCSNLIEKNILPKLVVILVGNNPASLKYVEHKKRLCQKIGAHCEIKKYPKDISQEDFINSIQTENNDQRVHGIIIQLPLPEHLMKISEFYDLIAPTKDIDGFGVDTIKALYRNTSPLFTPCTPQGIVDLLLFYNITVEGKNVVIIGRSLIVGKPLSLMLTNLGATVTLAHSKTKDIAKISSQMDLIISAIGVSQFINEEFLNQAKNQIIIDVGINHDFDNRISGDVNQEAVLGKCQALTPVPGGVGPMTVLSLVSNLIRSAENNTENNQR